MAEEKQTNIEWLHIAKLVLRMNVLVFSWNERFVFGLSAFIQSHAHN